jgi:hypothetical protein
MVRPSPLYQLIESQIDGTLAEFVAARRASSSWAEMAEELSQKTGRKVSDETLRRWFANRITVKVTKTVRVKVA